MEKQSQRARPRQQARVRRTRRSLGRRPVRGLIIEKFLPVVDIVESRSILVEASPEATYQALKRLDFAEVPSLLMRALTAIGMVAVNRARRQRGLSPLSRKLTLETMKQLGRVILADVPGREIVIGVIERPGDIDSMIERRTKKEFEAFDCPGHIKAAASFQMAPHGEGQTLLTYEVRTRATDTGTRRRLFMMDRITAALSRFAMRRVVEYTKTTTERGCPERQEKAGRKAKQKAGQKAKQRAGRKSRQAGQAGRTSRRQVRRAIRRQVRRAIRRQVRRVRSR